MAGSSPAVMRLLWLLLPCVLANRQQIKLSANGLVGAKSATNMSAPVVADATNEGQTVTFTVASWAVGNMVQFKNGEDIVFEIQIIERNGVKLLARKVADSLPDTWGGWPLGATGFALTLTSSSWQFEAIYGATVRRMPWYDYYFNSKPTVTGYEVTPPEAMTGTVAPKVCRIQCVPSDECSQCPSNPENCKSKTSNRCLENSDGKMCCDGIVSQNGALTINSVSEGDTVRIVNQIQGDPTYLDRSCASIGADKTCGVIKSLQTAVVQKLVVMKKEVGDEGPTGVLVVYVPSLATTLHFSPWALLAETVEEKTFTFPAGKPGLTLDAGNGRVLFRGNPALGLDVPNGWFVKRINTNKQYTLQRLDVLSKGTASYTITFSDVPELQVDSRCISDYSWTDDSQNGCSKYEGSNWCTKVGGTTDSWRRERCRGSNCPFTAGSTGLTATDQCCACGGGTFDPNGGGNPAPTPPGPPPPFDCDGCWGEEDGGGDRVGVQMVLRASNADYATLNADSALTENLRTRVQKSCLDNVASANGARADFQGGSINMVMTLWHSDGKADQILADLRSKMNDIRIEVSGALNTAEFETVVTGEATVTVYTEPAKVTVRSGLGTSETFWDRINALFGGFAVVALAGIGGCCLCCCFGACFVMRGSSSAPPHVASPSTQGAEIPDMRRETVKSEKYDDALHGSSFAGTTYAAEDYTAHQGIGGQHWDAAPGTSQTYGEDRSYGAQDDWDQHGDGGRDDRDDGRDERSSDRKKDRNRKKNRGDDDDQGALPRDRSDVSLASNVSGVSDAGQGGKLEPKSQRGARHRPSPRRR